MSADTHLGRGTARFGALTSLRGWVVLAAIATTLLVAHVVSRPPVYSGDSFALVQGVRSIQTCLEIGINRRCNEFGGPGVSIPQFPPLQNVPAYALMELGLDDAGILKGLTMINVLAFVGLVALFGYMGHRTGREWAVPLLVLSVIASPLLLYSWYTFAEMLATLLVAAPVIAGLLRARAVLLALLVMLACATKETAVVFVVPTTALALWASPLVRHQPRTGHWIAIAVGTVLGLLTHAALNQYRYGTFTNEVYTQPYVQTPGIEIPANFFVALWWAPNAGNWFFWPVAAAILVIPFVVLASRLRRGERDLRAWIPPAVVAGLVVAHTVAFSRFAAPFGWVAWGSRYWLPLLPSLVLLTVVLHQDATERTLQWIGKHLARRLVVAAVIVLLLVPQIGVLFKPTVIGSLFEPDPTYERCPRSAMMGEDLYFDCIIDFAWRRPVLWDASSGVFDDLGPLYLLVFGATTGALVFAATRRRG